MAADKARSRRFGEPAKFLPVIFVIGIIATLYGVYTYTHLFRLLQVHTPENQRDEEQFERGVWQTIVFNVLLFMLLVCLVLTVVTPPGSIPDRPEWNYETSLNRDQPLEVQTALETKKTGERRFCKWKCGKYKPDRAHHCRVCDTCVLRMDHHCPWVYNCIGFRNHKYFWLLLFYSSAASIFTAITMLWTVNDVLILPDPSLSELFLVLFGETLSCFMALIVTGFYAFHLFLAVKGLTTIEFCEKQKSSTYESVFSRGVYGNFQDILGRNPLIWLLPFPLTSGDGLSFDVDLSKFNNQDNHAPEDKAEKGTRSLEGVVLDNDGGTGGVNPESDEKAPLIHQ